MSTAGADQMIASDRHGQIGEIAQRWHAAAQSVERIEEPMTPALVIDGDALEHNVDAVIEWLGDPGRWRPHVKTVKLPWAVEALLARGVTRFKCATTLELRMLVDAGAPDVLFAMNARGANARVVRDLVAPGTQISVLVETEADLDVWAGTSVSAFIDVDTGLGRSGLRAWDPEPIVSLARATGERGLQFAGLHAYEGDQTPEESVTRSLDALVAIARALEAAEVPAQEVVTSGSCTAGWAARHQGLAAAVARHTIGPGTVVLHDLHTELLSPWRLGFRPAATVISRVISTALSGQVTCDAGHKAVSADAGDPIAVAAGWPGMTALPPSEEHLTFAVSVGTPAPALGDLVTLVPMHVCPTVNLYDAAILVREGAPAKLLPIVARGHEMTTLAE